MFAGYWALERSGRAPFLPSRMEMVSITNFAAAAPGPFGFPKFNAFTDWEYWTTTLDATPSVFRVDRFWNFDFGRGEFRVSSNSEQRYYRSVRSPAQPRCYRTRYEAVDSGVIAGAVKDNSTGLIWQRDSGATTYTWSEAKTACGFRGVGWRLPSVAELQSITDDTRVEPAIDTSVFQVGTTKRSYFWSSTPLAGNASRAWLVATDSAASNIAIGDAFATEVTSTSKVRCVQ